MTSVPQKFCRKCEQTKPLSDFAKHKKLSDGLQVYCKECNKQYRAENKERLAAYFHEYQSQRKDHIREVKRIHRANNRERIAEYFYSWLDKTRAKHSARSRRYFERLRAAEGSFSVDEWRALCERHNNVCLACGADDPLTPDHVLPLSQGGLNYITNIQPLCWPCNRRKRDRHIDYR